MGVAVQVFLSNMRMLHVVSRGAKGLPRFNNFTQNFSSYPKRIVSYTTVYARRR